MGIINLNTHATSYVTVAELAEYWEVTRQLVYKHIQNGLLPAMRLGPRCFRVRTADALEFERALSSKPGNGVGPSRGPRLSSVELFRHRNRGTPPA
jgi:excisionase family DNA binding protein